MCLRTSPSHARMSAAYNEHPMLLPPISTSRLSHRSVNNKPYTPGLGVRLTARTGLPPREEPSHPSPPATFRSTGTRWLHMQVTMLPSAPRN